MPCHANTEQLLCVTMTLTTNFEKDGGEGGGGGGGERDQKWFLELPRATPGSLKLMG